MTKPWDGKNRRNRWKRLKLKYKFPIIIGGSSIFLMTIVSVLSFLEARAALTSRQDIAFAQLLYDKEKLLENWLEAMEIDLRVLANGAAAQDAIVAFRNGWDGLGDTAEDRLQQLYITDNPHPTGQKERLLQAEDGSDWSAAHGVFHAGLRTFQQERGYYDLFLFDLEGNMVYSVFKELDFATNFLSGVYASSDLGVAYQAAVVLPQGELTVTDFAGYAPSNGAPAKFVAMPVFDRAGERIGVAALQLPIDQIGNIISNSPLLGETGQIYAVGYDGTAKSGSTREGGHEILDQLPELPQIMAARNGQEALFHNVLGLSGNPVVSYTNSFAFHGTDWNLILEQDLSEAEWEANRLLSLSLLQGGIVMFIIVALSSWIAKTLTSRIEALANSVNGIASGDFDNIVAQTKTGDELGDIARALERFKTELADGRTAISERVADAEKQAEVMKELNTSLGQLAEGRLDCAIGAPFPQDYEGLRGNFNETVAALTEIINNLQENAVQINEDAERLSEGTNSLSRRTENQAATLEETAAAMDQISASVKSTASGAKEIVSAVDETRNQAERGEDVGGRAVSAMKTIEGSSDEISKIVQLIDDIAFQTNLLALNAGVEAARAGEAGRGFAVVASEVRALAQRSSDSAAQIRGLIVDSSNNIEQGVKLVSEMGEAIKEVLSGVSQVSELIHDIAEGAHEQATGLSEINTGILSLDKVTQENAAMVEQSAASSRALQQKASEMRGLVARFEGSGAATGPSQGQGWSETPPLARSA